MIEKTLRAFDIEKIALSGQCFRIKFIDKNKVRAITKDKYTEIEKINSNVYKFSCSEDDFENTWKHYFDLDNDSFYENYYQRVLDYKGFGHEFIFNASKSAFGMRILNQEPFETLISYIISQRNNIKRISGAVESLSNEIGESHTDEMTGKTFKSFPSCDDILSHPEVFDTVHLGYRDEYVKDASKYVKSYGISSLDTFDKAKDLNGVGDKVANCYCLYGLHQLDSFPIDIWMKRILADKFNNSTEFLSGFTGMEGLLQQMMFYYGRESQGKLVRL